MRIKQPLEKSGNFKATSQQPASNLIATWLKIMAVVGIKTKDKQVNYLFSNSTSATSATSNPTLLKLVF